MLSKKVFAIAVVGVLLVGVVSGTVASVAASPAPANSVQDETATETQEESGAESQVVSIVEAMEAAQNETNGTAVGAEQQGDFSVLQGGGAETPAGADESPAGAEGDLSSLQYNVDVLLDNGTQLEVAVNAANGSVVDVSEADEGFLAGIFGEDDVPDRPLNLSAMYTASEAVELAQNETGDDATVTAVNLNEREDIAEREGVNETLVYEVQMTRGEGEEITVVVAAFEAEGGVIMIEGGEGTAETPATETETGGM